MPEQREQSVIESQKPETIEELKGQVENLRRWLEASKKRFSDIDEIIDSIGPIIKEVGKDPTKKELALLNALETVRYHAMLETKTSWPTVEEAKSHEGDLTMDEATTSLQYYKDLLQGSLKDLGLERQEQ